MPLGNILALLYYPPLLMSESRKDFDALRDAIQQQIVPRDFIENLFVADMVDGEWEMQRLRRAKVEIVKMAYRGALRHLIQMTFNVYNSEYVGDLVQRWFTNKRVRRQVSAALQDFGLDEAAIDAEALRQSMEDLEPLERRIAELESRRDKNLRRIEDHRAGLATRVQASSERCSDGEAVLSLAHQAS